MSTKTVKASEVKASEVKAVPFFARFLEEQRAQHSDTASFAQTLKYPSDWEEY